VPANDAFVIARLRSKPVEYKVIICHYVSGGRWMMGLRLEGVGEINDQQRERIAFDLREAARLVETAAWEPT